MSNPAPAPEGQIIIDETDLRKYRIELPNLCDDAELDPFEFRLLTHYKRVGKCTESLETTAKKCCMSEGKASQARQSLADKGWISLQRVEMDKTRYRFIVRVVDRWIENFARYSGLTQEEIIEQLKKGSASPREASPSPHEGKKELFKNLDERFGRIAQNLAELTGGGLNSSSADLINTWLAKHTEAWILKAIEMAKEKGARHPNYVDKILIGWEANDSPKSRDEKVQGAKHGNNGTSNRARTKSTGSTPADNPGYSEADRQAAQRVTQRRREKVPTV